ncbi:hypothetical protein [Goodfellowiella coeruleoviolacea]|nr:hypothetical protein [Goodfellowiella coeruleoviolacea]
MKLFAYHDSSGNIAGLAFSPTDDAIPAEVTTERQPGIRATEVQIPTGVTLNPDDPQSVYQELGKLVADYRVEQGSLAKKT